MIAYGTHCKACDALLSETHHDPELCTTCLEVVFALTEDLHHDSTIITVSSIDIEIE